MQDNTNMNMKEEQKDDDSLETGGGTADGGGGPPVEEDAPFQADDMSGASEGEDGGEPASWAEPTRDLMAPSQAYPLEAPPPLGLPLTALAATQPFTGAFVNQVSGTYGHVAVPPVRGAEEALDGVAAVDNVKVFVERRDALKALINPSVVLMLPLQLIRI